MQLRRSSSLSDLASEFCSRLPATTSFTTTFTGKMSASRSHRSYVDFDDFYANKGSIKVRYSIVDISVGL